MLAKIRQIIIDIYLYAIYHRSLKWTLRVILYVKHLQDLKYQVMSTREEGIILNEMPKIIRQSTVLFGTKNMLPQLTPDKSTMRR